MGLQGAKQRSLSRTFPLTLFAICAAWLIAVAMLWWATDRAVPVVNVRWVPGITDDQRSGAEEALSLVLYEPKEPDTGRYLLFDSDERNLRRIVLHKLVEDTAFIDRGAFVLDHPPYRRTWIGERYTTLRFLLYLGIFGCLGSVMVLQRTSQKMTRP